MKDSIDKRAYVSERELEKITGIKARTWQKHRFFNRGPRFVRICGAVRYPLQETLDWIESSSPRYARGRDE